MNCTEFGNALNDLLMKGIASIHEKMKAINAAEIKFKRTFYCENHLKATSLRVNNKALEVNTEIGTVIMFCEMETTQPDTIYQILEILDCKEYEILRTN